MGQDWRVVKEGTDKVHGSARTGLATILVARRGVIRKLRVAVEITSRFRPPGIFFRSSLFALRTLYSFRPNKCKVRRAKSEERKKREVNLRRFLSESSVHAGETPMKTMKALVKKKAEVGVW